MPGPRVVALSTGPGPDRTYKRALSRLLARLCSCSCVHRSARLARGPSEHDIYAIDRGNAAGRGSFAGFNVGETRQEAVGGISRAHVRRPWGVARIKMCLSNYFQSSFPAALDPPRGAIADPHRPCPNPRRPAAFPHLGRFQVILARLHTGLEGWTTHSLSIGAPGRRNASRLERDRRALGRTRARTACAGPKPGSRQSRSAGEAAHRAHEPCLPPTRLSWPAVRSAELLCGPDIASGCALGHQGIGIVATSGQAWSPATA